MRVILSLGCLFTTVLLGCAGAVPAPTCPNPEPGSPVASTSTTPPAPPAATTPPAAPTMTFADAVKDAAVVVPTEVSTRLSPLIESNPRLVSKGAAPNRKLLFVTWTSWDGYDKSVSTTIPLGRETWVTPAPDMQEFCRGLTKASPPAGDALPPAVVLRLEQLLGLPSGGGKDRFVEIWADPADVFRPCPDPETTDRECSLDFPAAKRFVTVSEEHMKWFEKLRDTSYGDKGYPWTRLGYTYDWGGGEAHVGLSEYVIRAGAAVEIKAVAKNGVYCR
jgi:hypothetical protein